MCSFPKTYVVALVMLSSLYVTLSQDNIRPFRNTYAETAEAPYAVFIKHLDGIQEVRCTGTLLDKNWVLTVASCVAKTNISSIRVYASIRHGDAPEAGTQTRNISDRHIHPNFKPDNLGENDIAVLLVVEPFAINANVEPISVEEGGWPTSESKRECQIYGYGDIDYKLMDMDLKRHRVSAFHANTCPCARRNQWMNLVCLDPMEDVGLCAGDAGAPLVCAGHLVGINHMLISRNNCSGANPNLVCGDFSTVSYFTYICPYLDWLKQYVPTLPNKPAFCAASHLSHFRITLSLLLIVLQCF